MPEKIQLITCSQCGYQFSPQDALRCPRCNKPVISPGGCSGSCGKCLSAKTCGVYNGRSA